MIYVALVVLHALVAIVWFGLSLRLQFQASLSADASVPREAWASGTRTVTAMTVAAVVFYALAVGAFFTGGGFSAYTMGFHVALTLGLVLVLLQVLLLQPAWTRLADGARDARKRVAMALGISHALWLLLFVLMFSGPKWQVHMQRSSVAPAVETPAAPAPSPEARPLDTTGAVAP